MLIAGVGAATLIWSVPSLGVPKRHHSLSKKDPRKSEEPGDSGSDNEQLLEQKAGEEELPPVQVQLHKEGSNAYNLGVAFCCFGCLWFKMKTDFVTNGFDGVSECDLVVIAVSMVAGGTLIRWGDKLRKYNDR